MTVHRPLSPGKYRVQVDDYLLLSQEGAFGDARTELIEGDIWIMSPAYSRHAKAQARLAFAFESALIANDSRLCVFLAPSLRLGDDTMPEPDLALGEDHADGPLPLAKVRLVAEVADATLATDLGRKAELYAAAGVAEYWVADVAGRALHQLFGPASNGYAERRIVPFGQPVTAATIPGLTIATDRL